jgi:hypothetical protein
VLWSIRRCPARRRAVRPLPVAILPREAFSIATRRRRPLPVAPLVSIEAAFVARRPRRSILARTEAGLERTIAATGSMLAVESPLTDRRVLRLLRIGELLLRVAMLAAGTPVATAAVARRLACRAVASARARALSPVARRPRFFRRTPQPPLREPLQLGVGVLLPKTLKRRLQLVALRGAKRGRETARDDRPVGKPWRHVSRLPFASAFRRASCA